MNLEAGQVRPDVPSTQEPVLSGGTVPPPKRPWLGLGLLGLSAAFSLALLIYFGAWTAAERAEARERAAIQAAAGGEAFWEDGARWVCPLH